MAFHPMTAAGVVTWFSCWIWIMNNNVNTCNNGEKIRNVILCLH